MGLRFSKANLPPYASSWMSSLSWPETVNIAQSLINAPSNLSQLTLQGTSTAISYARSTANNAQQSIIAPTIKNTFSTISYARSAANDSVNAIKPVIRAISKHPKVQKTKDRTRITAEFTRAAWATFKEPTQPLKDIPRAQINHVEIERTHNKAHGLKRTAIFPLGHATTIEEMEIILKEYDAQGIDVMIIPLPEMNGHRHAKDGRTIDQVYDDHMRRLIDINCEIYDDIPKDHQISIILHSSSSTSFLRATKENDDLAKIARARFSRIIHHGTMLETVGSSFLFNALLSKAYNMVSARRWFKDKKVGSTPIERYVTGTSEASNDAKFQDSIKNHASHGQAHFLKKASQRHLKSILANNESDSHFQQMEQDFYIGKKETAACWKTVQYYARVMLEGAICHVVEGAGHNLIIENDSSRPDYKEVQQQCANFRRALAEKIIIGKKPRLSLDEVRQEHEARKRQEKISPSPVQATLELAA